MFTDMVGYSALTQKDEKLALRLLEEHRAIVRPLVTKHGGHEIKTIGDAFLVEFASALAATACAMEIQKTLFERSASKPDSETIRLRIGLHIGDVVYKEHDVFGDGVNIASRIEPLAEPGGICLSEDVARQIQNKIDYSLVRLGKGELKNINLPVDLYRIIRPWEKRRFGFLDRVMFFLARKKPRRIAIALILASVLIAAILLRPSTPPNGPLPTNSVAVLPFVNIGTDSRDEYFAEGMTEELISSLSKIRDLNVIARTSVAKFKGVTLDITEIGNALHVGSILEGSVRTSGDEARISVNLVDVQSQKTLLTREYTRSIKDVFAIQSDIAQSLTHALSIQLLSGEKESLEKKGTENSEAYRQYLLGRFHLSKRTGDEVVKAITFFEQAVSRDTAFALAYAGLAECYTLAGNAGYGSLPRNQAIAAAKKFAGKAIALDESQAEAHASLAYVKFRIDWDWGGAEKEFKRALQLKPGYARAHEWYALFLSIMGRFDEAMAEMLRAQELDPLSASVSTGIGRIYHFEYKIDQAIVQFNRTLDLDPEYAEAYFGLGMTYMIAGRYEESIAVTKKAIQRSGSRLVMLSMLGFAEGLAGHEEETRRIIRELRDLSKKSHVSPYYFGILEMGLGRMDEAFRYFQQAYEERDGILIFLAADPIAQQAWNDPRFVALSRKMGLQVRSPRPVSKEH
ncbi:MAG: tetratricopeptide repeat protein [Ignavibacteriales bacterium]|nr:tetratricopeptide repeat protein [Ignavibacteriales bacterium]